MIDIDEIDIGIRDWVLYLINNGFKTFSSCQGSGTTGTTRLKIPFVQLYADDNSTCKETVERLKLIVPDNCYININKATIKCPCETICFNPPYSILIHKVCVENN